MASTKLQKPTHESGSHPHPHPHEEQKFGQKISEMTAKVFGHKQPEHHETAKHCTTCQCAAAHKGAKPAYTDQVHKKEHGTTASVKDTKSLPCFENKKKEGHSGKPHKDGKHTTNCIELKKKEKHHMTVAPTKESKPINSTNKEHRDKPGYNYFSSMTEHLKEKIMMKKNKDDKIKYSSSSDSDSSSDDESSTKKQQKNKMHTKDTKHTSK